MHPIKGVGPTLNADKRHFKQALLIHQRQSTQADAQRAEAVARCYWRNPIYAALPSLLSPTLTWASMWVTTSTSPLLAAAGQVARGAEDLTCMKLEVVKRLRMHGMMAAQNWGMQHRERAPNLTFNLMRSCYPSSLV